MQARLPQLEHNVHPTYRPDIDGLRAVAILSVVIFHVFPDRLKGGFVGVDIFFVISGFLISSIIFRSLQRGDFSFTEFYAQRARRIFPALILVLAVSFAFGWFSLLPDQFKQLGKHMAAGAGFVQNFVLWNEAGYFDTASELKPLMHLWSLAIEEQFYLIYPLLIWGAWRLGFNLLYVLVLLGLLSFGLNVDGIGKDTVKTFFLPHTRFWELMAGSVLAYLQLFKRAQFARGMKGCVFHPVFFQPSPLEVRHVAALNSLLSFCGFLLIVASVFDLHKGKLYPGWWALAPVLGAFLFIVAGSKAWVNRKFLANRLLVFIGLISYPLYLWHWPLLSFTRIVESGEPSWKIRITVLVLSFLMAWITYQLIEKPVRFGRRSWIRTVALYLLIASSGFVGYNTFQRDGLAFRQIAKSKVSIANDLKWDGFWIDNNCEAKYGMSPCQISGENPDVIILGDSHANHLYPGLASYSEHVFLSAGTCSPLEGVTLYVLRNQAIHPCAKTDFLGKNLSIISASKSIRTVILSVWWRPVLDGIIFNEQEGEQWGGSKLVSKYPEEQNLSRPELVLNGLKRTIGFLKKKGLKIIFVRGTFDISQDVSEYCHLNKPIVAKNCSIPKSEFMLQRRLEDELVENLKNFDSNLIVFDPINLLCDKENCFLMRGGVLYYRDQHHLSISGSKLLAEALREYL